MAERIHGRWEQGSEFHWLQVEQGVQLSDAPWTNGATLWGSGRDAMRALLEWGREQHGWKRLWCPSYFCQEVVAALISTGLQVVAYHDSPLNEFEAPDATALRQGDVLLVMNFFGLRTRPSYEDVPPQVILLEDHTHNPWSEWAYQSRAHWCVASLRKTLPLPDGGVLWSPMHREGPPECATTAERESAASRKFSAMILKHEYLRGLDVDKAAFRDLSIAAEPGIASGAISGISTISQQLLKTFPVHDWQRQRRQNHQIVARCVAGLGPIACPSPASTTEAAFSAILLFESQRMRDAVRQQLIEHRIYPAILWSLEDPVIDGVPAEHAALANRMLSIHCDMRYDDSDMIRICDVITDYLQN